LTLTAVVALMAAGGATGIAATPQEGFRTTRQGQTVAAWLQPPPVLPIPSQSGPEGPPRPFGAEPPLGAQPAPTDRGLVRAQNRALLDGPFPRGGLTRGVSDGIPLFSEEVRVRELELTRIRDTGARTARIPVSWREFVAEAPPPGFQARDPASPVYRFARLDASVKSVAAAGLEPLLVIAHAPAFAEAPHRWPYAYLGSWAPDPAALEEFADALARRYDGSFPDPATPGRALPRVRLFQAWNEPNLARYLEPQWVAAGGRWHAFSPLLYRQLLNAFYAGIKSVQPADVVISAGVAPNGEPAGEGRMAPVSFLREMLCLGSAGSSATRGPVRRSGSTAWRSGAVSRRSGAIGHMGSVSCPEPPHFDALAFHPLSVGDPDLPAESSLDVSISDAAKITGLLKQAERDGTALPAGKKPVWVTELNWESAPPAPGGVPGRLQAQWISRALHRLWVAGVGLVDWQFLVDPYPAERASTPMGGIVEYQRPAGLYSAGVGGNPESARPKPFLGGFTFPFDPLRVDRKHVRVWALLTGPGQGVLLQRWGLALPRGRLKRGRTGTASWRTIARLHADRSGVLNVLVSLRGVARLRLQSGALTSAAAVVPTGRSRL
jgi:hypothetical protein